MVAWLVKKLPAMQETLVRFLDREDPLEEGMTPTPVFLPGESPWIEESGGLQSMGLQRVGYNRVTKHIVYLYIALREMSFEILWPF